MRSASFHCHFLSLNCMHLRNLPQLLPADGEISVCLRELRAFRAVISSAQGAFCYLGSAACLSASDARCTKIARASRYRF